MFVENFTFEVTRRCNMSCAHCMCGDAQDVDMPYAVMDAALKGISAIGQIAFAGGEPSLNTPGIAHLLGTCMAYGIPVFGFYVETNGMEISQAFLDVLDAWDMYCIGCRFQKLAGAKNLRIGKAAVEDVFSEGNYMSEIVLSTDFYHEQIPAHNIKKLMTRRAFSTKSMKGPKAKKAFRMGRAKCLPEPDTKPISYRPHDYAQELREQYIEHLYLNAKGYFLDCAMLSYEEQETRRRANIRSFMEEG